MVWLLAACATGAPAAELTAKSQAPDGFWDHWGDGKAELAGYVLKQPRYGQTRDGHAIYITVTEDFRDGSRVKADGKRPDANPVLKLNAVRDFQTGIYDYNVMTSSFLRLDGSDAWGVPTKIAFSSQEWCGHVYDQVTTHDTRFERVVHSYFEGEDLNTEAELPAGAIYADTVPLLVRGLVGQPVAPGQKRALKIYPRLFDLRMLHEPGAFEDATLERSASTSSVTVPAGAFDVETYTLAATRGTWIYAVEQAAPHRLIRWTGPEGESGELTGSVRGPYWSQSGNGQEKRLEQLGLPIPKPSDLL